MTRVNVLHITDVHLGQSNVYSSQWSSLQTTFWDDVKYLLDQLGPIHIIAFTGDIAFSGQYNQFELGTKLISELRTRLAQECGVLPQVAVVPGNHDLVRPSKDAPVLLTLLDLGKTDLLEKAYLGGGNAEYRNLIEEAFANYNAWRLSPVLAHIDAKEGVLPGDYVSAASLCFDELSIGIIGLNSTFLQLREGDFEGKLALLPGQLNSIAELARSVDMDQNDVNLLLTHQPLTWLNKVAQDRLEEFLFPLKLRVFINLFGHMHAPDLTVLRKGGGEARHYLQGKSLFGLEHWGEGNNEERLHGYSVISIDKGRDSLSYVVTPRAAQRIVGRGWDFNADHTGAFDLPKGAISTNPQTLPLLPNTTVVASHHATQSAPTDSATLVRSQATDSTTAQPQLATGNPNDSSTTDASASGKLLGDEHRNLLAWLRDTWIDSGPAVCFIEGFSGVGKTSLADELMNSVKSPAVMVDMPENASDPVERLLPDLGTNLARVGFHQLAIAMNSGTDLPSALATTLSESVLIVIDEFHRCFTEKDGGPVEPIRSILNMLARPPRKAGRVLCLSNQLVEKERWSEGYETRRLHELQPSIAETLLSRLLKEAEREAEVPLSRRRDVVMWLGRNPRAIQTLVGSLEFDDLDTLIGLDYESWEARDRPVSPELLHRLERGLLERTLSRMSPGAITFLQRLSVFRKPVKRKALELVEASKADLASVKDELIRRFLLEQHSGWFSLHPIAREIALSQLRALLARFREAHRLAAQYYTRHFNSRDFAPSGNLGGYFLEARYHLVQANREADLREIALRFGSYLQATLKWSSRVPVARDELDERIAMLAGYLVEPGPRALEFHLARLLKARGSGDDLRNAFLHAERAAKSSPHEQAWLLYASLAKDMNGPKDAIRVYQEGIAEVPPERNLFSLYQACAELMAQNNQVDEAIKLLQEGIKRIPPEKNLFSLYQACAELIAQNNQVDEAIKLLQVGASRVPEQYSRYKIVEALLLLHFGRLDSQELETGFTDNSLHQEQRILAKIFALQLRGDWHQVANAAHEGRRRSPRYGAFYYYEAFSLLCAGDARAAVNVLQSALLNPDDSGHFGHWLWAFCALRAGDTKQAAERVTYYLGRALKDKEIVSEPYLLGLWRAAAESLPRTQLAYNIPVLPPALTGLGTTVSALSEYVQDLPELTVD